MTKYFVDADGNYIGGYDGVDPPSGSIEVPSAPDDARQKWDAAGEVWGAAPATLPDLQPYQFWAMLDLSDYRDDLEAFVANLPGDQKIIAQAKLNHTLIFRRDNPLVEAARQGIGLSNEELDALWLQAAAIS